MPVKLRPPDLNSSITIFGVSYSASDSDDGSISVPREAVELAKCHGYTEWVEDTEDTPEPTDEFAALKRLELIAWLKDHKRSDWLGLKLPELRALARSVRDGKPFVKEDAAPADPAASTLFEMATVAEASEKPADAHPAPEAPNAPAIEPTPAPAAPSAPVAPITPEPIEPVNAPLAVNDNPEPIPAP